MWKLSSYSNLVFFGNHKTKNRPHKTGKRKGVGQGNVRGITGYNPFELASLNKGNRALIVMKKSLRPEIRKEYNRIFKRFS